MNRIRGVIYTETLILELRGETEKEAGGERM